MLYDMLAFLVADTRWKYRKTAAGIINFNVKQHERYSESACTGPGIEKKLRF